jgi:uncharacterized Zn finger protein
MSWYYYQPYQTVGQRRAKAQKVADGYAKRGEKLHPVSAQGNKLVRTFWGKGWCDHMESFSDFASRLPKGKSYVRNGAVIDLQVLPGRIKAKVVGTETYDVDCRIDKLPADQWADIKQRCGGQIGSLVELLQGKMSSSVMSVVTDPKTGLFPGPREIRLGCTCPDFAHLCKHVASALYGVGIRLDDEPELLFKLRGVDHMELIDAAVKAPQGTGDTGSRMTLANDQLADVFGIEMAPTAKQVVPPEPKVIRAVKRAPAKRAVKSTKKPKPIVHETKPTEQLSDPRARRRSGTA